MPGNKGQYIEKSEWDVIYWPRKNNYKFLFFRNLETKLALCVYGEYAKWRKNIESKRTG